MKAPTLREAAILLKTGSARELARRLGSPPPVAVTALLHEVQRLETFIDVLVDTCRGQCTGFGWAVFDRDVLYRSGGEGRAVISDGVVSHRDFTADTRLNVHSISKTIAAAMIVRALHLNESVRLESPIGPFLRPDWEAPAAVKAITFEQLLVHDSGLLDVTGPIDERSYAGMKTSVERGILQVAGVRDYQNVNFALLRVLLPYVDGARDPLALAAMSAADFDRWTTDHFIAEVHRHLFRGEVPAEVVPEPNGPLPFTRYYDVDCDRVCDIEPLAVTRREHVGASSWWMSALEYGRFISRLQHARDYGAAGEAWSPWMVMSDPARARTPSVMKSTRYRLGVTEESVGDTVPALGKSGGGGGGRPSTAWLAVGELTAVLCINSSGGDLLGADDALKALAVLDRAARKALAAAPR